MLSFMTVTAPDTALDLAELLTCAARRLRRSTAAQLTPFGLTFAQAHVLRMVAGGEPPRMAEIAARLEVVPRSATGMVDTLEEAGLVARSTDPADRRSVLVTLTGSGRALLHQLDGASRESARELFGALETGEQAQLAGLLARVCDRAGCPGQEDGR